MVLATSVDSGIFMGRRHYTASSQRSNIRRGRSSRHKFKKKIQTILDSRTLLICITEGAKSSALPPSCAKEKTYGVEIEYRQMSKVPLKAQILTPLLK